MFSITIIIVAVTVLISIAAFNNDEIYNKLILWPRAMHGNPAEYYRLLTSGFIHADWNHLFFNMFTLYFAGESAEEATNSGGLFMLLYLSGIIISSLPSFVKNRNNSYYRSLGASGGVSAILFLMIYFHPWDGIGIIFIPIHIPCIIFGGMYLAYEYYMSKRGDTNINHDAHLWGALYGLLFAFCIDPTHGARLIEDLMHPQIHLF